MKKQLQNGYINQDNERMYVDKVNQFKNVVTEVNDLQEVLNIERIKTRRVSQKLDTVDQLMKDAAVQRNKIVEKMKVMEKEKEQMGLNYSLIKRTNGS